MRHVADRTIKFVEGRATSMQVYLTAEKFRFPVKSNFTYHNCLIRHSHRLIAPVIGLYALQKWGKKEIPAAIQELFAGPLKLVNPQ